MAARDDDQVAGVADGELGENFLVFLGEDFVGFGEPLAIGEGFAVVDDDGGESGERGDFRDALGDVAGAEE